MIPGSSNGTSQILKPEHLPQINNALDTLKVLQNEIDLAKRANLNVAAQQAKLDALTEQLRQIKQVYFPGQ